MARDYGKIFTAAWGDPAYRALTGPAQHLYMQLVSQPDTTMAGVLTTAPARWAGQHEGGTVAGVQAALDELERNRFVVTDPETMETLVRAFVRRDLGWRSPRTMIAVDSSIRAILSPMLRGVLAEELRRCDTSDLSDQVSEKTGQSTRAVVENLVQGLIRDCTITPPEQGQQSCGDTPSDTPSDGVRSSSLTTTATTTAPANAPANAPERGRAPEDALLMAPEPEPRKRAGAFVYPDAFEKFWQAYPDTRDKKKSFEVWRRVVREVPNEVLVEAAQAYRDDPNRTDGHFTKIATTWLNAGSWENGPLPARSGPRTDNRPDAMSQGFDTVARLRAQREARTQQNYPQLKARTA